MSRFQQLIESLRVDSTSRAPREQASHSLKDQVPLCLSNSNNQPESKIGKPQSQLLTGMKIPASHILMKILLQDKSKPLLFFKIKSIRSSSYYWGQVALDRRHFIISQEARKICMNKATLCPTKPLSLERTRGKELKIYLALTPTYLDKDSSLQLTQRSKCGKILRNSLLPDRLMHLSIH